MCPDSKIGGAQGAFGSPRGLPARTIGSKICIEFHYIIFNKKVFFEKMYKKIFLKNIKLILISCLSAKSESSQFQCIFPKPNKKTQSALVKGFGRIALKKSKKNG